MSYQHEKNIPDRILVISQINPQGKTSVYINRCDILQADLAKASFLTDLWRTPGAWSEWKAAIR
jgi:hypothetical protein